MPPRPSLFSSLRALSAPSLPSTTSHTCRTFSSTTREQASSAPKRRHRDPYALAQARARKAANISRRNILKEKETQSLGDPVRGISTPFVQSFDSVAPPPPTPQTTEHIHAVGREKQSSSPSEPAPAPNARAESHLNFYLTPNEIEQSLTDSAKLLEPVPRHQPQERTYDNPADEKLYRDNLTKKAAEDAKQAVIRDQKHATATEAISRIASLANASSKDRMRVNIQRCISTFGRHTTDLTLRPKPAIAASIAPTHQLEKLPRAGPDTGSSEVQVAILTAKIKTLADFLETRGSTDKANKRNLRLLVHKRQKHLTYLRRKERGGPRWQHLIETLGLTEGTWKGEISL